MKTKSLLRTMLLLCALIVGGSSVWAADVTLTAGTNGSACKVNNQDGIKIGTSKAGGDMTITVPANTNKLTLYAAAWKGVSGLSLNISGAKASPESIDLTADEGISNNSPFTLSGNEGDFMFEITLSGITTETEVKLTTATAKRCVIWGASAETSDASKADPELSFPESSYNAAVGVEFTPPTLNHATGFSGTVEYTSSDENVAQLMDSETGELRIMKAGTTTITATFAGNDEYNAGSASYTLTVTDDRKATTTSQDNIILDLADIATLTRLAPVVKDADGNVITYQYDEWPTEMSFVTVDDPNYLIGSIDNNTGEITLNAIEGTATMKALYNYFNVNNTYQPSECTFTISVFNPLDNIATLTAKTDAGTYMVNLTNAVVTYVNGNYAYIQDASGAVAMYKKEHGLTAGDVFNGKAIVTYQVRNGNPQITSLEGVTPTAGEAPEPTVVSAADWNYAIEEVLSQHFQVTGATITETDGKYYVTLNGEQVQLYKVGEALSNLNPAKKYTLTGFPTLYVTKSATTKELQIFDAPVEEPSSAPIINADDVTIEPDATSGEIAYNIENPSEASLSAVITEGDWISNVQVEADKVTFTATANIGLQRTATITLSYTGAEDRVITVTQKVCAVAALPFAFDSGIADAQNTPGLTQTGLGSDYSSSPKLKFDTADDALVLRIDEVPGALTFDVKGNSFSGGTFKVQTSADGATYEDLATYTALSSTETMLFNLDSSVRYIKWVYTEKVNGNVALGNISLKANYAAKIGKAGYATFCSTRAHDFTGVTAYVVSEVGETSVSLKEITSAPANTPVILKAAEGIYELNEVESPEAVVTNKLQVSDGTVKGGEGIYALANKTKGVGFYVVSSDVTIPAGKVYLDTAAAGAREFLGFDMTTGVNAAKVAGAQNGEIYNLKGQRVAQPTTGLYIVNGKKVIVK